MDQMPSCTSSRPTGCCWSAFERKSNRCLSRIVPAFVTRLTRKWPGYSTGGRAPVYGRSDGWYSAPGGRSPRASCGRSSFIETAKGVESALLAQEAGLRRTTGFALESFVHPLVSTVLLWMRGQDALVLDAEPQPPDVETREPVDAGGGEGHAVIGANGAGQPVLPKEPIENGVDAVALGGQQAVARQKIAGVLIGDRKWVAINRVPRTEVALEVRRPEIVGLRGHDRDDAGMLPLPPAAALLHQAAAGQKISGRAHGGPVQRRLPRPQPGQEFGGAPARMLTPC